MLSDSELRTSVLTTLGLLESSQEAQDKALYYVESIAQKRLGLLLPELLNDDQLEEVGRRREAGENVEDIMDWVQSLLPQYDEIMQAIIQDIAEETAG